MFNFSNIIDKTLKYFDNNDKNALYHYINNVEVFDKTTLQYINTKIKNMILNKNKYISHSKIKNLLKKFKKLKKIKI